MTYRPVRWPDVFCDVKYLFIATQYVTWLTDLCGDRMSLGSHVICHGLTGRLVPCRHTTQEQCRRSRFNPILDQIGLNGTNFGHVKIILVHFGSFTVLRNWKFRLFQDSHPFIPFCHTNWTCPSLMRDITLCISKDLLKIIFIDN